MLQACALHELMFSTSPKLKTCNGFSLSTIQSGCFLIRVDRRIGGGVGGVGLGGVGLGGVKTLIGQVELPSSALGSN